MLKIIVSHLEATFRVFTTVSRIWNFGKCSKEPFGLVSSIFNSRLLLHESLNLVGTGETCERRGTEVSIFPTFHCFVANFICAMIRVIGNGLMDRRLIIRAGPLVNRITVAVFPFVEVFRIRLRLGLTSSVRPISTRFYACAQVQSRVWWISE